MIVFWCYDTSIVARTRQPAGAERQAFCDRSHHAAYLVVARRVIGADRLLHDGEAGAKEHGPFAQQRLDEMLGLAVGPRRVGSGADVADTMHPQRLVQQLRSRRRLPARHVRGARGAGRAVLRSIISFRRAEPRHRSEAVHAPRAAIAASSPPLCVSQLVAGLAPPI